MSKRAACVVALAACAAGAGAGAAPLESTQVQPELFAALHALSNAFADFDGEGGLDRAVSYENGALRLFRNESGTFAEAGAQRGLPVAGPEIRGLSLGNFDRDGDPDLYVGVSGAEGVPGGRISKRIERVDPRAWTGRALFVKADD